MRKTVCGILTVLLTAVLGATAQNPIIRDQFAADPTARVYNNKVYLYPSHDIPAPEGQRQDWFCMADYHVFSSENLIDWTDHGVILTQENVPWGNPNAYSMWAPDCVCKDGTYYFYFPNAPRQGRGFAIGVATAASPEGPFTPLPESIKGVSGIDPCVLIDNDGQAYIYWSGMGIRGARLKSNMTELEGPLTEVALPQQAGADAAKMLVGGQPMEGLPEGFKEGPFAFRRGNWYYLTFPWVRHENGTETLAYAMSQSPLGPWDFKGIIMEEHPNKCWTNHHSIVEYRGQWYLFYHHNDYSPQMDKRRSPHIDRIGFNADGTIVPVQPTLRGVGIMPATHRIQIDRYTSASRDSCHSFLSPTQPFLGWQASLDGNGQWITFADVDFTMLADDAYVVASVRADGNASLCLREQDGSGKVIARFDILVESSGQFRRDQRNQWITVTAPIQHLPKGIATLCLVNEASNNVAVDWIQFKNRPRYFGQANATTPSQPDELVNGTERALAATAEKELTTVSQFTGADEQLWRIEQAIDGTFRIMPKRIPGQQALNTRYCLYSAADSTPTLALWDFSSDNSKWRLKSE